MVQAGIYHFAGTCYKGHMRLNNPVILAVDTSVGPFSVALARGGELLSAAHEASYAKAAAQLVPMIERVLGEAHMAYNDVEEVRVCVGPGSFTGLRIGISAANAIGFATGARVRGISSLALLAAAVNRKDVLAVLLAGKGQVFAQRFSYFSALDEIALLSPQEVAQRVEDGITIAGNAAEYLPSLSHGEVTHPRAEVLALLPEEAPLWRLPRPLYVRPPDAAPQAGGPLGVDR